MSVRGAVAAGLLGFAAGVLVAELIERARQDAAAPQIDPAAAELAPAVGWADMIPVGVPDLDPRHAVIGLADIDVSAVPAPVGSAGTRRIPRHRVRLARRILASVAELADSTAGLLVTVAAAFASTLAHRPRLLLVTSDRHAYALPIVARRSQVAGPIDHTHHARLRPVRGPSRRKTCRSLPVAVLT